VFGGKKKADVQCAWRRARLNFLKL